MSSTSHNVAVFVIYDFEIEQVTYFPILSRGMSFKTITVALTRALPSVDKT